MTSEIQQHEPDAHENTKREILKPTRNFIKARECIVNAFRNNPEITYIQIAIQRTQRNKKYNYTQDIGELGIITLHRSCMQTLTGIDQAFLNAPVDQTPEVINLFVRECRTFRGYPEVYLRYGFVDDQMSEA